MSNEEKNNGFNRVVITGMGAISPAGFGVDALWSKVASGECCFTLLPEEKREQLNVSVVGAIPDYDPLKAGFSKKESRRFAPFVQYAILASDEAMAQAGIDMDQEDATRFACVFGSGIGGMEVFERESIVLHEKGAKRVSPLFIPTMISNMAAGNLAIRYGLKGDCLNIVTACSTGTHCVGEAYRLIRFGLADAALAGGTEEGITNMSLAGFGNLGAITKSDDPMKAGLPFDARRSGFVAGEGAGALVLESLEHAQARGANIIAEITGFGSTGDAYHMTAPERRRRSARYASGAGRRWFLSGRCGPSKRSWHGYACERHGGSRCVAWPSWRRSCFQDSRNLGKGHGRPHVGRSRRYRSHRDGYLGISRYRSPYGRLR